MYKARTVINSLIPLAPRVCGAKRFASWLVRSNPLVRTTQVVVNGTTQKRHASKAATEPFLNGSSSSYVEEMYNSWLQDPHSVHVVSLKYIHSNKSFRIQFSMIFIIKIIYFLVLGFIFS